jgi:hypothetical protein
LDIFAGAKVHHYIRLDAQNTLTAEIAVQAVFGSDGLAPLVAEHHVGMLPVEPHHAATAAGIKNSLLLHHTTKKLITEIG